MIPWSSKDTSVSGTFNALKDRGTILQDRNLWTQADDVMLITSLPQTHLHAHSLGHERSDVIGKQCRVFLLLLWWMVNRQELKDTVKECQLSSAVMSPNWATAQKHRKRKNPKTHKWVLLVSLYKNSPRSPLSYVVGTEWAIRSYTWKIEKLLLYKHDKMSDIPQFDVPFS